MLHHRASPAVLLALLASCAQPSSTASTPPSAPPPGSGTTPAIPSDPGTPSTPPPGVAIESLRSLVPARIEAACGTATIDGVISPDEWSAAVKVRFGALLPESFGGGTVPAEIMAMSDGANLYVAYRYEMDTSGFDQSHTVELDANHSGGPDDGDDAWLITRWAARPWYPSELRFFDDYRESCVVDGVAMMCGREDTDPEGRGSPGTTDGGAAFGFGANQTVVEMWHPYHSGDARDVAASPGDLVPLTFSIRLLDTCADYPRCYGDTDFPGVFVYRPFLLACGAPPPPEGSDEDEDIVEVHIDVKPGDPLPSIQLGSGGVTTVAVLGSEAFDVAAIDPKTLWFAGAPIALDDGGAPWTSSADVNGDGVGDLVSKFETAALKLTAADTEASLAGRTLAGRRFHGTDAVRVLP